ncbi:MAG: glycoside hydrolase [Actinomycetota bacterium]|nr:glycoside hydrolase [Actinomycetota bacterium]
MKLSKLTVAVLCVASIALASLGGGAEARPPRMTFQTIKLDGADGGTEPRVSTDTHGRQWLVTNTASGGDEIVYQSNQDGSKWTPTKTPPSGQQSPTIDVDIVTLPTGRIISSELDFGGINFRVAYSDDGGKTWTNSTGSELGDTDRQWMAVGPKDASTGDYPVYEMFHNLASGEAQHQMWVQKSSDSGETFGAPVPITGPQAGPQGPTAQADLQCADSGGPSSLSVNKKTGEIVAVWGTRHSAAGGCGAQPAEANIVGATEVWVATSSDGGLTWVDHLAVDDSAKGNLVGMQLSPGTIDNKGNVYVVYPESPNAYPNYDGAAIKYKWISAKRLDSCTDPDCWSAPVTVAPTGGAGNILPHIVVGDPGKVDVAYFHGVLRGKDKPAWYTTVSQTLNGTTGHPSFRTVRVSGVPTYTGTASELMGACTSGNPVSGVVNGFTCGRSTDVWGITLGAKCTLTITWPTVANDAPGADPGTFVSVQRKGAHVCKTNKGL